MNFIKSIIKKIIKNFLEKLLSYFKDENNQNNNKSINTKKINEEYLKLKEKLNKVDNEIKKALLEENDDAITILMYERDRIINEINNLNKWI